MNAQENAKQELSFTFIEQPHEIPHFLTRKDIVDFFHYKMQPYHDEKKDINNALDYAFDKNRGGFLLLATTNKKISGATLFLKTGMGGYIPENLLLFVAVDPQSRGRGIGRKIIEKAMTRCDGDVKLHVEVDNPASRLYERLGFEKAYLEMRYKQ